MAYVDPNLSLKDLIQCQRKVYKKLLPVWCPMLRKDVKFNAQGFEHLHMDGRKHRRGEKNSRARLLLLEHAPAVISQARFMKEDIKPPEKSHSGKTEVYHELYAKVGVKQVAVVLTLRTIGNGDTHFYGIRYKWKKTT
jgi:hypothetical protein